MPIPQLFRYIWSFAGNCRSLCFCFNEITVFAVIKRKKSFKQTLYLNYNIFLKKRKISISENLCTRRVLRPVSAAACQTRKKSVDFALSTEKARACTQTYITAADDRKKGVRHALISRLVEMTGLAPVYSYGQKDFSTYLALIDNVGTTVYQANPVVPESVMPFFPPDERKNRSLLKHAEYKSAELFTSTAATRLQRARNY